MTPEELHALNEVVIWLKRALDKQQERHEAELKQFIENFVRSGTDTASHTDTNRHFMIHEHAVRERIQAEHTAAVAEALERAVQVADSEEEPAEGEMPPSIINSVLAQDTVAVERAIIAAVRATKKNIAANIRSLKPRSDMVCVPKPHGEDATAYNAAVISTLTKELLGPIERERLDKALPWIRSVVTDLIRRIANLRAMLAAAEGKE